MKTAIITGASSGLGREFVRQLPEVFPEVECVWLVARRKERLEEIAQSLGSAKCMNIVLFGGMVRALHMETIDWESVIAETVPEKFRELNLRAYRAGYDAAE